MHTLQVNGVHLLGATLGFLLIHYCAVTPRRRALMWPAAIVLGAALAVYLFSWTEPHPPFNDFRRSYWKAGEAIWRGIDALRELYVPGVLVFVNAPVVAVLFAPFGLLPPWPAAYVFLLVGLAIAVWIWRALVRMYGLSEEESALALFAMCVFGPLLYTFREANTSHHMLALLLGGMMLYRAKRQAAAGALFGLIAVIKPAFVLIGVLYLLRGRWRVVAGGAAVCLGAAALSLAIFGWGMHLLWYEAGIRPYAAGIVPAFNNWTIEAFLMRAEIGGPARADFTPHDLSPRGEAIAIALKAALAAGLTYAVWRSGRVLRPTERDIETELLMVVIAAMLVSPLSWAHYFTLLLPAFVLAWTETRPGAALHRWRLPIYGAFALTAPVVFISWQMQSGRYEPFSNLVASHGTIGTLALLAFLAWRRAARRAD